MTASGQTRSLGDVRSMFGLKTVADITPLMWRSLRGQAGRRLAEGRR